MDVTILVCTWNRAALLEQTLDGFTRLHRPEGATWELLVVDNGSTDDTQEVLSRWSRQLPLRVELEPEPGKSHALNRGVDAARGTYVLCTDDDVLVEPSWLSAFVEGVRRHPHASVFGGRIVPWFPVSPDPDLVAAFPALGHGFCALEHDLPEGPLPPERGIFGANLALRTSVARTFRFDGKFGPKHGEQVVGEERDVVTRCREAGHRPIWLPHMVVRHYVAPERMTLEYLVRYYHDWAVTVVRREGVPDGPRLFGAPRWAFSSLLRNRCKAAAARLTGRRLDYLLALRDIAYATGLREECARQARETPSWQASKFL
jgi:glycosyltransferase involved in cell wall biosynthesis